MSGAFYSEDSDKFYFGEFWEADRAALQEREAALLPREEANRLGVGDFLTMSSGDAKPQLSSCYEYFAIPYELDDEVSFCGARLVDCVVGLINQNLERDKFFASTDPDKCCVVSLSMFREGILWAVASGHLNTPFVVFDRNKKFFALLDYDLPLQIVGYTKGLLEADEVGKWQDFLHKEWPAVQQKYKNYTNLQGFVKRYYSFLGL